MTKMYSVHIYIYGVGTDYPKLYKIMIPLLYGITVYTYIWISMEWRYAIALQNSYA